MTRKLYLYFPLVILLAYSCRKAGQSNIIPPTITSTFDLADSLKINSQIAAVEPDLYNRYNDKIYVVHSVNKVGFNVRQQGADIIFEFADSSVSRLVPSFSIKILHATFASLLPEYDLTNIYVAKLSDDQEFAGGSRAISFAEIVNMGVLKISYDKELHTVSGEVAHLKFPVGYYVLEDIGSIMRST